MASLTIAQETSIKSLADGFMAGWLTTEDFSRPRRSSVVEIVLVNRMVQLFSWYLIEKLLEAVHESSPEAEESIKRWTRVHKGGRGYATYKSTMAFFPLSLNGWL